MMHVHSDLAAMRHDTQDSCNSCWAMHRQPSPPSPTFFRIQTASSLARFTIAAMRSGSVSSPCAWKFCLM